MDESGNLASLAIAPEAIGLIEKPIRFLGTDCLFCLIHLKSRLFSILIKKQQDQSSQSAEEVFDTIKIDLFLSRENVNEFFQIIELVEVKRKIDQIFL